MIERLKGIILDSQELEPEVGVSRRIEAVPVPGKAMVCLGVRRSGKSTYLFQIMERLRQSGVPGRNILYLNFFDDRLHPLKAETLGLLLEAYFSLYPEKKSAEKVYCFFDEIQLVPGWEPFVDRLLRTENCEVYITGSSAHMLSKEIATQMRGRALAWEMFPFSFREFLDFKGIEGGGPLSTKRRLTIRKAFDEFWETGGFPEVLGLDRRLRTRIHQDYFNAMLFRDLVERHDIPHPRAVADLAHRLMDDVASLYTLNRLAAYLKSMGHKVPKASVGDYLAWSEDAYILFTVRLFDASRSRSMANPKKVYCVDHALAASVASGILLNAGHLLENLVFTALRRVTPEIFYVRTRGGQEVDFIALGPGRSRRLVQVCESLAEPRTRTREVAALSAAMAELDLDEALLVTRNEEERIPVESGSIRVVPAWRFLLEVETRGEFSPPGGLG